MQVVVGLRESSPSVAQAREQGLEVLPVVEAASRGDLVMILLPDELHRQVWESDIADGIAEGNMLLFGHGFSIHYGEVAPPPGVDVAMVAPKGPGHLVRRQFVEGSGVPGLIAVAQDATGRARELALAYAKGIGCTRGGVIETTFKDETETDLFGEQAVLCGGVSELVQAGFETLVTAGYDPEMAYFECLHEVKLIVDLMYEKGLAGMRYSISNTAEYGDYTRGKRVITEETRASMRKILAEIQSGDFAREWIAENRAGQENFLRMRAEQADTQIEAVGKELRSHMDWITVLRSRSDGANWSSPDRAEARGRALRLRPIEGPSRGACAPGIGGGGVDGHLAPAAAGQGARWRDSRRAARVVRRARGLRGGAWQRRGDRVLGRRRVWADRAPLATPDVWRVLVEVRAGGA